MPPGAPEVYRSLLALPSDVDVTWIARPGTKMEFLHVFVTGASELKAKLRSLRPRIAPAGVI